MWGEEGVGGGCRGCGQGGVGGGVVGEGGVCGGGSVWGEVYVGGVGRGLCRRGYGARVFRGGVNV